MGNCESDDSSRHGRRGSFENKAADRRAKVKEKRSKFREMYDDPSNPQSYTETTTSTPPNSSRRRRSSSASVLSTATSTQSNSCRGRKVRATQMGTPENSSCSASVYTASNASTPSNPCRKKAGAAPRSPRVVSWAREETM